MEEINSIKRTARIAGLWYLFIVIVGIYGLRYVSSQIIVRDNAVATAANMLAHEFLFRTGILSAIIGNVAFIPLVMALYKLFEPVNQQQAKLMIALVLMQVAIGFVIELFNLTALMILKNDMMKSLNTPQKQDLAMLFINMHKYGIMTVQMFWGLWLIPLGQLVYKSGFVLRIIGALLFIGGIAYVFNSFTYLLFPDYTSVTGQFTLLASLGEISIMLWLLIIGVKIRKPQLT